MFEIFSKRKNCDFWIVFKKNLLFKILFEIITRRKYLMTEKKMEKNVHDNVARRSLKQREGKKIKKEKKKEGKNLLQCFTFIL